MPYTLRKTIPENNTIVVETIAKIINFVPGNGMANLFTEILKSLWKCIIYHLVNFLELKYSRVQTII